MKINNKINKFNYILKISIPNFNSNNKSNKNIIKLIFMINYKSFKQKK